MSFSWISISVGLRNSSNLSPNPTTPKAPSPQPQFRGSQHKPQKPSPLVLDNSALNEADSKAEEEKKEEGDTRQERACKGRKYKELVETGAVTPRRERKVS